jgi:hypothetical protein
MGEAEANAVAELVIEAHPAPLAVRHFGQLRRMGIEPDREGAARTHQPRHRREGCACVRRVVEDT